MTAPEKIKIVYEEEDDARFDCIGRCSGARQFMAFVTGADPIDRSTGLPAFPNPSDPTWRERKRWYAVVHVFDSDGKHLATDARLGGTSATGQEEANDRAFALMDEILSTLGELEFCDIEVRPFRVEIDGYLFGLVHDAEADAVALWPNDVLFHPPFDGEYST